MPKVRLSYFTPTNILKTKSFDSVKTGQKYGAKIRKRKGYAILGLSSRDNKTGVVKSYKV